MYFHSQLNDIQQPNYGRVKVGSVSRRQPHTGCLITQPAALSAPLIAPCVNNCESNQAGAAGRQEPSVSGLTPDKLMLTSVQWWCEMKKEPDEDKLCVSQT